MNSDLLLKNVAKHIELTKEEEAFFLSLFETRKFKSRQIYLNMGEVCQYSAFVNDGALKSYTVDNDGKEHILSFAISGWWIADMYSYISRKPAVLTIEAIADSEVLLMSYENHQRLYAQVPKFERFFRIIIENSLVANQERLLDNLSTTAEERYLRFLKKYPQIPACVPQHSIASYLGITPEFLSKIRNRLAKRKI